MLLIIAGKFRNMQQCIQRSAVENLASQVSFDFTDFCFTVHLCPNRSIALLVQDHSKGSLHLLVA